MMHEPGTVPPVEGQAAPVTPDEATPGAATAQPAPRLRALDAFRGITILLMLLVNNIALDTDTPAQLLHAPWNGGVHLADFVMPWFLFAMGVAIPFSVAGARRKGIPAWRGDLRVLLRAVALVALGCLIDSSVRRHLGFSLGVLQIIGLAYLVAALVYDLPWPRRAFIAAGLLVGYWAAIKYIPVPDMGVGVFEETRNLIYHLNRTYLGPVLLWGLPSIVPTAALAMIGSLVGDVLRRRAWRPERRLLILLILGWALTLLGMLWSMSLPFNKPVWTPPYILLTAGVGTVLLGLLYLVMDLRGWRQWAYPFLVFGANAILAYVAPILVKVLVLRTWTVGPPDNSLAAEQWLLQHIIGALGHLTGGCLYTLGYIGVWWLVLWVLYRKGILLRV